MVQTQIMSSRSYRLPVLPLLRSLSALSFWNVLLLLVFSPANPVVAQSAPPRFADIDPRFVEAHAAALELPRINSLLVSHESERVFEQYYHGTEPYDRANIKSASKTVMSALVGLAIDRGLITSVRQPIGEFFPEQLAGEEDRAKRAITIEDLLTMRSGLESTSSRNYGRWVLSDNWVDYALAMPLVAEPGTRMIYSTGNTHLLSAILTMVTGGDTLSFAQEALARPMGFSFGYWPTSPQGIHFGGNDMEMTPRQMLAFGRLYLNGGRLQDTQILPGDWVAASHQVRTPSPRGQGRCYGYGWWYRELAGYDSFFAWGYGGQFIFVIDDLDLVVAASSDSLPGDNRRGHLRRMYRLIEDLVVLPVAASTAKEYPLQLLASGGHSEQAQRCDALLFEANGEI